MSEEERFRADVSKVYEGDGIVVGWEPSRCIHIANCIRSLPSAFDPAARPWIDVDAANADALAAAVTACPTGALTYRRTDGAPNEQPTVPTTIQPRTNGPLFVRGSVEVVDIQGNIIREATRMALCRCGQSGNKPYCDLSHRAAGFRS